jgi:hypothetical protein
MDITNVVCYKKDILLQFYREEVDRLIPSLSRLDYKKKADSINKNVIANRDLLVAKAKNSALFENWDTSTLLECILMIYYTSYVVMLESRNKVWSYEYMTFSRRIGELWEPFCKLCFSYPINNIQFYEPPLFEDVRNQLVTQIQRYVSNLPLGDEDKSTLNGYFDQVWNMVTSGEIQLKSDLHFTDGETRYVVDFKSGFGSNEKGNTNRLLMVAQIYQSLATNYKCMIFVRSTENNHYLHTLQTSGIWDTSTGSETYKRIYKYSGYDIERWININIDWMNDFEPEMARHIRDNNLESYLIW